MNLQNLSPRQKKVLGALAAAGVLAIVVILGRRGAAPAAAPDAAALGATGAAGGIPTFADNGAAAGGLSSDLTGAFGTLQASVDALPDRLAIQQPVPLSADDVKGIVDSSLASWSATPSGAQTAPKTAAQAAAKAPTPVQAPHIVGATAVHPATASHPAVYVNTQATNPRHGQQFHVETRHGHIVHVYTSGRVVDMGPIPKK